MLLVRLLCKFAPSGCATNKEAKLGATVTQRNTAQIKLKSEEPFSLSLSSSSVSYYCANVRFVFNTSTIEIATKEKMCRSSIETQQNHGKQKTGFVRDRGREKGRKGGVSAF